MSKTLKRILLVVVTIAVLLSLPLFFSQLREIVRRGESDFPGFYLAGEILEQSLRKQLYTPSTGRVVTSADLAEGARVFRSLCVTCHGRNGTGGQGPDLTRGEFRYGNRDLDLFRIIALGIEGTGMPGTVLTEEQVWQTVAYVRSLSRRSGRRTLPGDRAAGERIYWDKGGCSICHMLNGTGGRQGPDLSSVGWLRSPEHLRTSLLEPGEEVEPRWWSIRGIGRDGETIEGILLNEDTFSFRILDEAENLRSFFKRDLREFQRVKDSSMPSYKEILSERELDNLVAYLYSLRGRKK
ncbi:MAG: c-type cytochrome [Acidobacteriota bacterium]